MAEEHVAAMEILKRKKEEYAECRKEVHRQADSTHMTSTCAMAECQLLLLEISYLESRILSLSSMDLSFIQ